MANTSLFMKFKNFIARKYGNAPAKMLVHTGVIGWIMSSLAQIAAIAVNDKIDKKQKLFLIPQEIADACVNIASFYLVTSSMKDLASVLVKSGKWSTKGIRQFLAQKKIKISSDTDVFSILENSKQTKSVKNLKDEFIGFKNGMDVIATTVGSVLSCNLITPVLRNQYASISQKKSIARLEEKNNTAKPKSYYILYHPKMSDFSGSSLKI